MVFDVHTYIDLWYEDTSGEKSLQSSAPRQIIKLIHEQNPQDETLQLAPELNTEKLVNALCSINRCIKRFYCFIIL